MANKTPDQLAKLLKFTLERMKEKVTQYTSCGFFNIVYIYAREGFWKLLMVITSQKAKYLKGSVKESKVGSSD